MYYSYYKAEQQTSNRAFCEGIVPDPLTVAAWLVCVKLVVGIVRDIRSIP